MGKYPGGPSGQGKAGNWLSPPSSACPGPKPSASLLSRRMPGSLLASRARGQRRGGGGGTWHGANRTWLALGGRGLAGPPPTHAPADPRPGFSCFCPGCGHKNGVPVLPLPPPSHALWQSTTEELPSWGSQIPSMELEGAVDTCPHIHSHGDGEGDGFWGHSELHGDRAGDAEPTWVGPGGSTSQQCLALAQHLRDVVPMLG